MDENKAPARPAGKRHGGRVKGTKNKRTWEARELAAKLGFDPLQQLILWAKGDWKKLGYKTATKTILSSDGFRVEVDRIDENLRQKSTRDLVPYLYPQLKSVEITGDAAAAAAMTLTQLIAATAKPKDAATNVGEHSEPAAGASSA